MSSHPPLEPGDVGTVEFPGARVIKRRPIVVISSSSYHQHRPDVIVALLTSNVAAATAPMDYVIQDWREAGLHQPSAFRAYLETVLQSQVRRIGRFTDRDWLAIRECLSRAIAIR